jgi:hypothetical protein
MGWTQLDFGVAETWGRSVGERVERSTGGAVRCDAIDSGKSKLLPYAVWNGLVIDVERQVLALCSARGRYAFSDLLTREPEFTTRMKRSDRDMSIAEPRCIKMYDSGCRVNIGGVLSWLRSCTDCGLEHGRCKLSYRVPRAGQSRRLTSTAGLRAVIMHTIVMRVYLPKSGNLALSCLQYR